MKNINCYAYSEKEKKALFEQFMKDLDAMAEELEGMKEYEKAEALEYNHDSVERAWLEDDAEELGTLEGVLEDLVWSVKDYMKRF